MLELEFGSAATAALKVGLIFENAYSFAFLHLIWARRLFICSSEKLPRGDLSVIGVIIGDDGSESWRLGLSLVLSRVLRRLRLFTACMNTGLAFGGIRKASDGASVGLTACD
jgi:hypothetical protein